MYIHYELVSVQRCRVCAFFASRLTASGVCPHCYNQELQTREESQ